MRRTTTKYLSSTTNNSFHPIVGFGETNMQCIEQIMFRVWFLLSLELILYRSSGAIQEDIHSGLKGQHRITTNDHHAQSSTLFTLNKLVYIASIMSGWVCCLVLSPWKLRSTWLGLALSICCCCNGMGWSSGTSTLYRSGINVLH